MRRRAIVLLLFTLAVVGCTRPEPRSTASAIERAACRQRADQVYTMQNRDQVYRSDTFATSTRDTPYGAGGVVGNTTRGLSGEFSRDQMVDDCLRSSAGNVGASPAAPASDAVPPP